jgi:transcriptional regulator with XRE-family HTH domain
MVVISQKRVNRMVSHEHFLKELAREIRLARERSGKSQMQVFLDTGIHMGRIEQGKLSIKLHTYYRICEYLNIDMAQILQQIKKA